MLQIWTYTRNKGLVLVYTIGGKYLQIILCSLFSCCFIVIINTHLRIYYMFIFTNAKWVMPIFKFLIGNESFVTIVLKLWKQCYSYTCWYNFICTALQLIKVMPLLFIYNASTHISKNSNVSKTTNLTLNWEKKCEQGILTTLLTFAIQNSMYWVYIINMTLAAVKLTAASSLEVLCQKMRRNYNVHV